jgi:hypothetical protein
LRTEWTAKRQTQFALPKRVQTTLLNNSAQAGKH